jgi:hypothetical protein
MTPDNPKGNTKKVASDSRNAATAPRKAAVRQKGFLATRRPPSQKNASAATPRRRGGAYALIDWAVNHEAQVGVPKDEQWRLAPQERNRRLRTHLRQAKFITDDIEKPSDRHFRRYFTGK